MDARDALEIYAYQKFTMVLEGWVGIEDIIAIGLYRADDYIYEPDLLLNYNADSHLLKQEPEARAGGEARWNYAYWPRETAVGLSGNQLGIDSEGESLLTAWVTTFKGRNDLVTAAAMHHEWTALWVQVAYRLHNANCIQRVFGRDLPLIMHDDDYSDETMQIMRQVNSPVTFREILRWMRGSVG